MESLNAADPRIATGIIVNTALCSISAHYISHGLPSQLHYALSALRDSIAKRHECPILAVNLRINYEFSFTSLSLTSLVDASFMACAKRICSDPVSKILILSFISSIHNSVSDVVLASSLVPNIPWSITVPLNYLANVFQTFSGLKQASETKLARILYVCVSRVFFTIDKEHYLDVLPFGEARANLAPGACISLESPVVRESMRSLLWSLCCIYVYYLFQQTRTLPDPASQKDLLERTYDDFYDLLDESTSPEQWHLPESFISVPFCFMSERDAMRVTNDVLVQRAFVMKNVDDEEEQILSEIDAWQKTEEAAQAENALLQDRPLVIADTGQRIRRHGTHTSAVHEMHVPPFPLKRFQEAKDSDETYTSDSYSFGVTFSDVDIIQRHMGPDFCIPLRITFYGLLSTLLDDSVETVRRMAVHVCNTIMGTVIQRIKTIDDVVCVDDTLLVPSNQGGTHTITLFPKVFMLASYHILRETLYINQAMLADSSISVTYLMGAMRFIYASLQPCNVLDDLKSNIKANTSLDAHDLTKRSMTFLFLDKIFQKLMLQIIYMSDVSTDTIDTLFLHYFPYLSVFSRLGSHDAIGEIRFYQNVLRDKKQIPEISELVERDFSHGITEIYQLLQVFNAFFTNSRKLSLNDDLMKHIRCSSYLGSFICGTRPFLCEFYHNPFLSGNSQAIMEVFNLQNMDMKVIQLKLREKMHSAIMQALGKGEFCNEIRIAFLWGFLLSHGYPPPSIPFSCDHSSAPTMEELRSFTQ